ncbi:MAG: ROK family protein [Dehalococcoidia bacterium]
MSDQRPAVGVDLGGTKIHSLVATPEGAVLGEDRRLTDAAEGVYAVIGRMAGSVRAALEAAGLELDGICGVGMCTPGPCDTSRGVVTYAPNLAGWVDVPIVARMSKALGVPALLEHDTAAACYGEFRFGAGRGFQHVVYVTLSTGIGGGMIFDGKLYHGASGAAGEVGHLIVDADGPQCGCGNRGCVEALASGIALAREAAGAIAAGRSDVLAEVVGEAEASAEHLHKAALQGDAVSREIIERAGRYAGLGLAAVLNFLNPQALILGGGLLGLGDLYLRPALDAARAATFDQMLADVTITEATLGERAGALGAAALMVEHGPR